MLTALAEIFQYELTKITIQAYWETLRWFDYDVVQKAMDWAMRNCEYFPRPAVLAKQAEAEQRFRNLKADGDKLLAAPKPDPETSGYFMTKMGYNAYCMKRNSSGFKEGFINWVKSKHYEKKKRILTQERMIELINKLYQEEK